MAAAALIMLAMIRILSKEAIAYDIKQGLKESVYENMSFVSAKNGSVEILDGFQYRNDGAAFLLIKKRGTVIAGAYPEGTAAYFANFPLSNQTREILCGDEKYYVSDIRIKEGYGAYLRGVVREADAHSPYRAVERASYLGIIGVFAAVLACEIFLSKKISRELENMCRIAEQIGSDMDMSQRMEGDSRFQEIAVLAQANNRMLDRMEKMFRMQEQFTSDVAHELRTPVAVVLAQCQYAQTKVKDREEFREVLEVIHRQSGKVNAMITDLLNFSRLDQNRMQLQDETLDLVEIVQSVCEDQQEKAGNDIAIRLALNEAVTRGDIGLIAIAIQNLVSNAIKFSHTGMQIDVRTGERDGMVFVEVQDYGIGIEPENIGRIFHRFYKCDRSRNAKGFGLGLPLSEKIVEKHGGRIAVVSEEGKGSIFTLYLPKKPTLLS